MMNSHLPSGWHICIISDVAKVNPSKITAEPDLVAGFVPMSLAPTDFNGQLQFEEKPWGEIQKSYTNFQNGDVIFAKVTPCFENGKAAIVDDLPNGIGAGSSEFYVLRPEQGVISNRLLFALLKTNAFAQNGAENMTGAVGLRRVPRAFVEGFEFPLPPLAEQKVIADKLDTLLAQVETTKARLERIPEILKRFRQSVLSAAVSGKLTEEWREGHSLSLPKEIKLGKIVSDGPKNGLYKSQSFYGEGIRIIRIDGFYDGEIVDWNNIKRLTLEELEYSKWKLEVGDILVNRVNSIEYLGKSAIVRELPEPAVFESNIMKFRVNPDLAIPEYIVKFLCSTTGLSQLRQNAKLAVNQASINQQDVQNCIVYLPELIEQTEIVRRVEELFAFADSIE
ncbi:restriction endonuclease subunit S [Shewanella algae]|nr:restriction endonuclease subunit S [Shewanella algae]MBO2661875.1 restriction endonuclease subunit S [Shewanella algae]MCL1052834.1 restriction endonuclease subunit S [Shewanella algae]